jgi:hypothetical protein
VVSHGKTGHDWSVTNVGDRGSYPEPSSTEAWASLGYPAALAKARAESAMTAPRSPETKLAFEGLVRDVFVPPLKIAGFSKTRNVWRRSRGPLVHIVDIQRGHATGDLIRFSSNWSVVVPGFELEFRRDVVVDGRIGEFLDGGLDRWWSIQLGWLAADFPEVNDDSERCRRDIASGLDRMIAWLDAIDGIDSLIATLERGDRVPFRHYDQRSLHELAVALRTFPNAP